MSLQQRSVQNDNPQYYLSHFKEWRQVYEFLLASNILAFILAVARVSSLAELSWVSILHHALFVTWVAVCFAVCVDRGQVVLHRFKRQTIFILCFVLLLLIVWLSTCAVNLLLHFSEMPRTALTGEILFHNGLYYSVLGGGLGLIGLRYLYVREQWIERQQSELIARVQALQARIHPHFLFNSLNSVVSLIATDPFKAEQLLIDLSRLFRASLTELKEVSLAEEIALCQRYLQIENTRLGDRLKIKWRIDGEQEMSHAKIPLLTLQPLLENCIYHGVESMSDASTINILIEIRGRQVSIVLTNPYQLQRQSDQGNGIAIDNVKQRLMAYYGANVKFTTYARNGIFTTLLSYKF